MPTTAVKRQAAPLREQVVQAMRSEIIDGTLVPGERLLEKALCERYGVSRTVIREVLRQLESESLVSVRPGHGPAVARLSPGEIAGLYEVRRELEGLAAELFARRADGAQAAALLALADRLETDYLEGDTESRGESKNEFYRLLLDGAGNPALATVLDGIHARIGIFRHFSFIDQERVKLSYVEILSIIEAAARDRDPAAARASSEHHIELAGKLAVLEYTKRYSSDPGETIAALRRIN
ncbi:GntR family transcriptional regulator [Leucobacter weissii]|uniref:GntR family transcriptional regulator n=1 Tax=Leucobacter weissii TaxID=1983706 RepID=A0A939MID5_9MICO|nr:GntR family transcriptional regulator [Leucobacter weissii]MBO1901488.1 GntR family transcriptional regulator [Leucobacter weissii]